MNEPAAHRVEEALERILASPGFQSSARMAAFLRFVVQHKLHGEQSPLKEYLIADRVFGRGESFDPRTDTIVRVEARRLRAKLEKYYLNEGRDDPVVIQLAPRGYTPIFRSAGPLPASPPRVPRRQRLAWAITALIALLGAVGSTTWLFTTRDEVAHFTHSIAVLPCLSVSNNPEDEALANGLSNDIGSLLQNIPILRVVAQVPPALVKDGVAGPRAIGRSLRVDAVLECAVRRELEHHNVTARLLSARDGRPIWTDPFEREFDGARSATEITRWIVTGLEIALTPSVEERLRPLTVSKKAYQLYSFGRHHWSRAAGTMQREHLEMGVRLMEQAIEADQYYAAAYAGLADALGILAGSGFDPDTDETLARAKWAARKAFELDENLAESQFAMGALHASEGSWAACDGHFRRAIALKPSFAPAYQAYAVLCLAPQQRYDEAAARLGQAIDIELTRAEVYTFLGQTLVYAGRTDEAMRELNKAIDLESGYVVARVTVALVHLRTGNYLEAKRQLLDVESSAGVHPYFQGLLGYSLARLGERAEATKALQRLLARPQGAVEVDIAGIYSGLGEVEEALNWLEKGHHRWKAGIGYIIDDPRFRNLHSNPRFVSLLEHMGLPVK